MGMCALVEWVAVGFVAGQLLVGAGGQPALRVAGAALIAVVACAALARASAQWTGGARRRIAPLRSSSARCSWRTHAGGARRSTHVARLGCRARASSDGGATRRRAADDPGSRRRRHDARRRRGAFAAAHGPVTLARGARRRRRRPPVAELSPTPAASDVVARSRAAATTLAPGLGPGHDERLGRDPFPPPPPPDARRRRAAGGRAGRHARRGSRADGRSSSATRGGIADDVRRAFARGRRPRPLGLRPPRRHGRGDDGGGDRLILGQRSGRSSASTGGVAVVGGLSP